MKDSTWRWSLASFALVILPLVACTTTTGPPGSAPPGVCEKPETTGGRLETAGFTSNNQGDWFYPPGEERPHIHLNAPGSSTNPHQAVKVDFIAISHGGTKGGRNLSLCPEPGRFVTFCKYNVDSVESDWWGPKVEELKQKLVDLNVAEVCDQR